ncbi:Taurine catabolism dioxygenase TauD, TfdA family [Chitinophaga sp. CF118]|uniref:TauD/TfdA family dioxygenase n=1 Tax=Chitinophaga sp. CF118 TaxID=1884367 RepID=UPI0008E310CA|nr:TauD/TfdA family dioxygenase [Chitinophaga sp. CF118]SFD62429.1 Taurine catabolism dioxygenase TauD, TfdA family [Chitinophaga sp. CF118]
MKPIYMEMNGHAVNTIVPPPLSPLVIQITPREANRINVVGDMLVREFGSCENPAYISELHLNAFQLLPERIVKILSNFGTDFSAAQYGAIIFKGLIHVDQEDLGPTPSSWQQMDPAKLYRYGFISSLLHGVVPSKPVQYFAQRKGGGLIHAVIPDEKMSYTQTGSGSKTDLFVHTEDAFLFNQADFLSFLFLRNEEGVPSSLYSIRSHGEMNDNLKALFKPIYKCPKDANYALEDFQGEDVTTSVLYGNEARPFIRFDAAEQIYNEQADQSPEAMEHLVNFWEEAQPLIYNDYVPDAGDLIFVNNHLCAHGRNAFLAGFRKENGVMVKCERRMMLRMMSKTSLINIQSVAHTDDPYLIMEEHYGSLFKK